MSIALNLLVMGKTGTGKSAFINYIMKKNVAKVGAGKAVTSELIEKFDCVYKDSNISIYDTTAIELDKNIEEDILIAFEENKKKADFDFIIYCISSSQTTIEAVEIEKLIGFRMKGKKVILLITSDDIKKGENEYIINKMKEVGFKNSDFVKASLEEKLYLSGNKGKKYGEIELFESVKLNLKDDIVKNVMNEFELIIERRIHMWSLNCQKEIKYNKGLFIRKNKKRTEQELIEEFNLNLKEIEEDLNNELISILRSIYRRYSFMYEEEALNYWEEINITSNLYLPDKQRRIFNFTIIDDIEEDLIEYWLNAMKEVI